MFKKFLLVSVLVAACFGALFWKGYLAVTPQGRVAGAEALVETKAQAKRIAAWTLEALFERK